MKSAQNWHAQQQFSSTQEKPQHVNIEKSDRSPKNREISDTIVVAPLWRPCFSKHKKALTVEHIPKKQGKWRYPIDKNGRMRGKVVTYLWEKDKGGTGRKNYSGWRYSMMLYVWYQSEWWRVGSEGKEKNHRKNGGGMRTTKWGCGPLNANNEVTDNNWEWCYRDHKGWSKECLREKEKSEMKLHVISLQTCFIIALFLGTTTQQPYPSHIHGQKDGFT